MNERYKLIITLILNQFSINEVSRLNENENREKLYMILLLLEEYGVFEEKEFLNAEIFIAVKNIRSKLRKAEEKLLINRNFRKKYYEVKGIIENII